MSVVVDNLIAWRILYLLVKPFNETDAYKLGIIDETGKNLIKSRDLETGEQKNAYTYLHRLVFNLKKLLNKLPGGESKLKNIVAAFFLVKESYSKRSVCVNETDLRYVVKLLDEGVVLAQEQLVVEDFLLCEDGAAAGGGIANVTGAGVSTDQPVIRKKRFARFKVDDNLFNKFTSGKAKTRKIASYLNMEDVSERQIYDYARKNPNGVIVLHNGKSDKAIQVDHSSAWTKVKRSSC